MNKYSLFLLLLLLPICGLMAQSPPKKVAAVRISQGMKIDGVLDEPEWADAPVAGDFLQRIPYNGNKATFKTEVKFLYDNSALYVGMMMFDPHPDSIPCQLGLRDSDWLNADDCSILLSPFNDGINAFIFKLYSSNVQADYKLPVTSGNGDDVDMSWDAVWQSQALVNDKGWVAEIRIPYSAIRFPKKDIQEWSINCIRNIRRYRENDSWNFVDSKIDGIVNQSGMLTGIADVKPPLRLSLTPYLSGYVEKNPSNPDWQFSYNFGADVKYGINQSFTLDMTLIPDFGQVPSDDKVYNFSPFEIQYDEKRQFFTEGTELFNIGDIFYSRRIGSTPIGYYDVENRLIEGEVVVENPMSTKLINATKLSGRTTGGLGIGVFNAMSGNTWATVTDSLGHERRIQTQGFTNYNMLVLSQALKNNSYVSVLNTNVYRADDGYSADVIGTDFKLANKKYTYAVFGNFFTSGKYSPHLTPDRGYHYLAGLTKLSGNFQFTYEQKLETDNYDPNDMGFNTVNNKFNNSLTLLYNIYDPFWKLLDMYNYFYVGYGQLYEGMKFTSLYLEAGSNATTKKHLSLGLNLSGSPVASHDYYEPRVPGHMFVDPAYGAADFWISTDYRKKLAVDVSVGGFLSPEYNSSGYSLMISPRFQPNTRLTLIYEISGDIRNNNVGYVSDSINDQGCASIIFGSRDLRTITNIIEGNYMFNSEMSINLRLRHYWVTADYNHYYTLQPEGGIGPSSYGCNEDINYNLFNVDLSYTWNFLPGSQLSVVWKNAINRQENIIEPDFFQNLSTTLSSPASNSLSLRVLVYIDALYFKKKTKKS
jgi:hypothetical protein